MLIRQVAWCLLPIPFSPELSASKNYFQYSRKLRSIGNESRGSHASKAVNVARFESVMHDEDIFYTT